MAADNSLSDSLYSSTRYRICLPGGTDCHDQSADWSRNDRGIRYIPHLKSALWVTKTTVIARSEATWQSVPLRAQRRHREEEARYEKQLDYIREKAQSLQLAKDIRIFGLGDWLKSIYKSVLGLYQSFLIRREKVYIWANVVDVVLSLARNGIAYFYLIRMALDQGLPASQFLLYFSAVSGFTAWVTGILKECSQLHKESLDISCVQEYLNLPEPFRFSGGEPVPKAEA